VSPGAAGCDGGWAIPASARASPAPRPAGRTARPWGRPMGRDRRPAAGCEPRSRYRQSRYGARTSKFQRALSFRHAAEPAPYALCCSGTCVSVPADLRRNLNRLEHLPDGPHIPDMAQSFVGGFHLVEVKTDELVRGLPKKQLWVAATKRDQAITLVLAAVPEGWTAVLLDTRLEPEEAALLNSRPGDVRELKG
jgi:hypothetical protein